MIEQVTQSDPPKLIEVVIAQEHVASSKSTISASATNFLHVVLNRSWHIVVDDTLNVAFVNTHTEGNGAAEDPDSVLDELLLDELSGCIAFTSVVGT